MYDTPEKLTENKKNFIKKSYRNLKLGTDP